MEFGGGKLMVAPGAGRGGEGGGTGRTGASSKGFRAEVLGAVPGEDLNRMSSSFPAVSIH